MSSGLVVVKCSNCHQETEIIPGTIVAECDHCGRLFRPSEGESQAAVPAASPSYETPPWEKGASADLSAPWDNEKENMTPAKPFPGGSDGLGLSAADARDADALAAEGVVRDKKQRKARDTEIRRKEEAHHRSMKHGSAAPEDRDVELEPEDTHYTQQRPAPAAAPSTASAAPAITIFVTLLVLAIGGYFLAKKEEAAAPAPEAAKSRPARQQGGRTAPPGETPVPSSEAVEPPVTPPSKALTVSQRIGMEQVEKHSVILSAEQAEKVKRSITHREKHPFHRWGSETPQIELVVFAPFSTMGIARLKQLNREFKKLEEFESRIAVWFVFHWGPENGLEAEAADIANAIHWTHKQEGMYHFVMLLQKEAVWRVASMNKLDEYIKVVGLDPASLRQKMKALPLQEIRKEVADLMSELHLPDKDLTFLIGGRSYLDGKTLYNVSKIVDYELSAREP